MCYSFVDRSVYIVELAFDCYSKCLLRSSKVMQAKINDTGCFVPDMGRDL